MMFYAHKEALVVDDAGMLHGRDTHRIMNFLEKAWKNAMKSEQRGAQLFAAKRYDMLRRYLGG